MNILANTSSNSKHTSGHPQQQPMKVLALGQPHQNLERYLDFLQYLQVLAEHNGSSSPIYFTIDVVNALEDKGGKSTVMNAADASTLYGE